MSGVSLHAPRALLPDGWARDVRVSFDGRGKISAVFPDVPAAIDDKRLLDRVLLPAPANLHSHGFQRALAGRTQRRGHSDDSFWSWRALMYRFLDALNPEMLGAITAQAQVEMLEAGYASVGEFHYLHHEPGGVAYTNPAETATHVINAARETGIGLCLLPVVYATGGADGRAPEGGQLRFACDPDRYEALWQTAEHTMRGGAADWTIGVAPHSLRAVPPQHLELLLENHRSGPVHIHIAEQAAEVDEIRALRGATPVAWLLDNHEVDERWCLVHATHMSASECSALVDSKAVAGLCPITEADLGDGLFLAEHFLAAGGALGVGTDSNVRITLCGELRLLEYGQRLNAQRRNVLASPYASTGRVLYDAALHGGARALERATGHIAPGYYADLLTLNTASANNVNFHGLDEDELLDAWIFSTSTPVVSEVWSAGRAVVINGRHIARDTVAARYNDAISKLLKNA